MELTPPVFFSTPQVELHSPPSDYDEAKAGHITWIRANVGGRNPVLLQVPASLPLYMLQPSPPAPPVPDPVPPYQINVEGIDAKVQRSIVTVIGIGELRLGISKDRKGKVQVM
ncbi:hypothetical protein Hypma_003886 [Hypsizygus marmoreus]|uniref:Uncharacterized protein n=1 Tax=Hypsizygus marmoreus TaxID=39966 RepID=A0A369K6X5_HYPMA|nr:hypothetical protein Hypma_003886 [Hypsizygus marmoreus]